MPSYNGNIINREMVRFLGRGLSEAEALCCEDMAYAFYTPAVTREIARLLKKNADAPLKRTFDHVYVPVMSGRLVGAKRVPTSDHMRFATPTNHKMYAVVSTFLGDGFSQKDLDEIVGICKNATMPEVQDAIKTSMGRGIRSASYIRSVILGRRRVKKAQAAYEKDRYRKVADPPPPTAPYAERLGDHFKKVIKELKDDEAIHEAAKRKLRFQ